MNASNCIHFSRCFLVLPLALTLSACDLGDKGDDLPGDSSETGASTSTEGASSNTDEPIEDTTTGPVEDTTTGPVESTTTDKPIDTTTTDEPVDTTTTDEPVENTTTGPVDTTGDIPDGCQALDEASCLATSGCEVMLGSAYAFDNCPVGPQYLGCMVADMGCDDAEWTVCRVGTEEVYLRPNGCMPLGFEDCTTQLELCGS